MGLTLPPSHALSLPAGVSTRNDNGQFFSYFLVNISNVDAVMTAGAKPVVSEVGPMPYRKYVQSVTTLPSDYGVETWFERDAVYYVPSNAPAGLKNYPGDLQTK